MPELSTAQRTVSKAMKESELANSVIELAEAYGWRVAYFPTWAGVNKRRKGFPDMVLVRDGRLIFAELKREKQKPSEKQQAWLDDLSLVADEAENLGQDKRYWRPVLIRVWRPSDLLSGDIQLQLAAKNTARVR
ncbi:MAG TPA: VRR-NUC domain-containing protein [Phycisphaerae bacterium]|nr:VRR-NUC domain-containing protein [Phycisphaerae bacterium]